jgi:hypothetical protein
MKAWEPLADDGVQTGQVAAEDSGSRVQAVFIGARIEWHGHWSFAILHQ